MRRAGQAFGDQQHVGNGDRLVVLVRRAQGRGVALERRGEPDERVGQGSVAQIPPRDADVGGMREFSGRKLGSLEPPDQVFVGHDFSLPPGRLRAAYKAKGPR
jgi:hypothetical protein